ncbi:SpoIIE family protein phosphatase [Streptomyces sp. SL13]|uniref:SpoIIE family protein phosphatase n=1 Tax=Streptantibioticus silvisoli TaxID=2705255 RepID=A0AA90H5E2_9ACTN|nr:SpoIIE family protein phosphatase [Streptantibioticus silvisoli]MDI5962805.1 SpoIIE family protein phosphatase [Streptantibioticus silvisoli]MDI5968422.1 SpoIIE family protein phosphatase [Streptantibioticus silvisoli]
MYATLKAERLREVAVVSVRLSVRHVTVLLLGWIALATFVQIDFGEGGLLRWSGYSVLTPVVAGALLPMRQSLLISVVNLVVSGCVYGVVIDHLTDGGRVVVLVAVLLASVVGVLVCRVRLEREERLVRLMVARDRLALLGQATAGVGTTLDVVRTARELADVATPRFADFVTVDLFDWVLSGDDPEPGPFEGAVRLRRVAHTSVLDSSPEAVLDLGEADVYPPISVPARSLAAGTPIRAGQLLRDAEVVEWLAQDPRRAAKVEDFGLHSGITIPLRARGATLGVAVFIRHRRPEPFDDDDLLLAEEITSRASVCLDNAHRYTREHHRSLTLQRSLMPRGLPRNAAVEAASRYLPAGSEAGVGGDWFDVIPLSGARVALVVGDVVGHGMHASATMGRLRAAVRTLADIDLPPDELLTHLDDVVTRLGTETDPGQDECGAPLDPLPAGETGATCLYAVYDPVSRRCTLARAGHPPPVLVAPDGTTAFVDLPAGPPLGLGSLPFESRELELAEGSLLALYTNGLVESRRREMDEGLDRLRHALSGAGPSLEATCDAVLASLLDDQQTDDIALLLARTRALDAQHVATWDLAAEPASVGRARDLATSQLAAWGLEAIAFTTELVVSELVTNAVRYGEAPVQLRLIREKTLICEVSDGSSTAPHLRRARTLDEGGRGLFIVAQLTDRWGTRHDPQGKTIWSELSLTPPV